MRARTDTIVSRIRWYGALAAVAALAVLAAIGPPGSARAATGTGASYNQITGDGSTGSALTVPWTQGLRDSSNQPITAANADRSSASPTSPLAFMYPAFKNIQVTVSQTQDITHQGITVSWTGAAETTRESGAPASNFMQLMECYGDSSSGPSPQGCEYGSGGLVQVVSNTQNAAVGTRSGPLCAVDSNGHTLPPNTSSPPNGLDGSTAQLGCDPEEPVPGASPPDTSDLLPQEYDIPFVPVNNPSSPAYTFSDISQYFNQVTTNEVPEAVTNTDGTGQVHFVALTGIEAPGLGCGQLESNGQTRNCWLVIVPRGTFEPNGYQTSPATAGSNFLYSSPLSASNWAMRIQVHLSYAPVPNFCPIGTKELLTVGTQVVARAVQSWQVALNQASGCKTIYGYSAVPEATSTEQLSQQGSGVGMAFTTIPIGSEAARDGTAPPIGLPQILYAPIAVSALAFGFNINEQTGYIFTPVKLTPELVAKSLTQVYLADLPDYYPNPTDGAISTPFLGPAAPGGWANGEPLNISQDQMFKRINPDVPPSQVPWALAPLLTEDHSALNQEVWQWIQGDSATVAWLNQGTPDLGNGVSNTYPVDPDYEKLQLGTAQPGTPQNTDGFPRAYSTCLDAGPTLPQPGVPLKEITRCSLDLLPYVNNYGQAAINVLTANNQVGFGWNSTALAPDGSNGWWDKTGSEPIGQTFMWGMSDTPDLASFGLIDAQLCDDAGNNCVGPSTASLTTAIDSAKPDTAGLLQVDPANPGAGGYPLTQVIYAAVATNQSAADLTADANLIAYAAGKGQTPGAAPGDLPPGYLPLPASLQNQATAVVNELRADANPSTSSSSAPSNTSGNGTGTTPLTPSGSLTPAGGENPAGGTSATAGVSIIPPRAQLAAQTTRPQPVGAIRWLLLTVVIAGAACAVAGTVLMSAGRVRWLSRLRT